LDNNLILDTLDVPACHQGTGLNQRGAIYKCDNLVNMQKAFPNKIHMEHRGLHRSSFLSPLFIPKVFPQFLNIVFVQEQRRYGCSKLHGSVTFPRCNFKLTAHFPFSSSSQ
jgi:hypothetical protein